MLLVVFVAGCVSTPQTRSLLHSPPDIPVKAEIISTPFYPQRDYQCGPAALSTVLNFSQPVTSPQELVSKVYVPELKGSLQVEMLAATTAYDQLAIELDGALESVLREVSDNRPVLVMQNLGLDAYPFWHYAVVVGYDLDRGEVVLRSGEIKRLVRPMSVFERTWQRADNWAVVMVQPDAVPITASEDRFLAAVLRHEGPGKLENRLSAYRAGVARWPDSFELSMGLGNSLYGVGDFAQAEAAFRRASGIQPERPEAWNNLAYALMRQNRYEPALQAVRRAIDLDPQNAEFRHSLEEIQQRAKN